MFSVGVHAFSLLSCWNQHLPTLGPYSTCGCTLSASGIFSPVYLLSYNKTSCPHLLETTQWFEPLWWIWETASFGSVLLCECGPRVKQQQGSNDCGCCAIVNCYLLCKGEDSAKHRPEQASYETTSSPALRNDSLAFSLQKLLLVQLGLTFSTYKLPVSRCTYPGCCCCC